MNYKLSCKGKGDLPMLPLFKNKQQLDDFVIKLNAVTDAQFKKQTEALKKHTTAYDCSKGGGADWAAAKTLLKDNMKAGTIIALYVQGHGSPGLHGICSDEKEFATVFDIYGALIALDIGALNDIEVKLNSCFSGSGINRVYPNERLATQAFENGDQLKVEPQNSLGQALKDLMKNKKWDKVKCFGYSGPTSIEKKKVRTKTNNPTTLYAILDPDGKPYAFTDLKEEDHMGVELQYYAENSQTINHIYVRRNQCRIEFT